MSKKRIRWVPALLGAGALIAVLGAGCARPDERLQTATPGGSPAEGDESIDSVLEAVRPVRPVRPVNPPGLVKICKARRPGAPLRCRWMHPAPSYSAPAFERAMEAPPPDAGSTPDCSMAPNTTACGQQGGISGGDLDTLYYCGRDGTMLSSEQCATTCVHRPSPYSDYCQ